MTRQGVNSSVNSDSPDTIRYLNQEAAKCVKWGGLTENEALRLVNTQREIGRAQEARRRRGRLRQLPFGGADEPLLA